MRVLGGFGMAWLVAAAVSLPASASVTWTVGAGANCDAHTIQDAVNLAAQSQTTDAKFIEIASDQGYPAQSIHVDNQSLGFVGGPLFCDSLFTGDPTVISGDGASGSVFEITGTGDISFYHLEIRDGNTSSGGGGIFFAGNGSLALTDVLLDFNTAAFGGGLDAEALGGTLDVYLNENTELLRNTATNSGGGIALSGQAYLYALQARTLIAFNTAPAGYGGGVFAFTPSTINIGSPGYSGLPVVFSNSAAYGGGIALIGDGNNDDDGVLQMFTMDASTPVAVNDNSASIAGGGIYLRSDSNANIESARMCGQDININDNFAAQGAALQLDWGSGTIVDTGSYAIFNPDDSCDTENLGAVHCNVTGTCNQMSGNVAMDSNSQPTDGAVVLVGTSSTLIMQKMEMHDNVAGRFVEAVGDNDSGFGLFPVMAFRTCLTGGNQFAHELIRVEGDDNTLSIDQCTFAPDIIDTTHVIRFDNAGGNQITMINTIVDEPGTLTLAQPGISQSIENILTNDDSTLPSRPDIIVGTPEFIDAAHRNFRQLPSSLGVDFAIATAGFDLDGHPRDVDLPQTPNFLGPRDLGAYETQRTFACSVADTIYCDGFEN